MGQSGLAAGSRVGAGSSPDDLITYSVGPVPAGIKLRIKSNSFCQANLLSVGLVRFHVARWRSHLFLRYVISQ